MILFQPESKVQKDRAIMRETDSRMAKYSRRGLALNVLAFLLCLSIGYLKDLHPTTALVLTFGLLFFTLVRGFVLARFETLYAAGPARWRNLFFVVTLLGAIWWTVILVELTLLLGMVAETPLLWMYSVIFFSTTLQVTAPFQRFSRIYLSLTLLPPIIAAFTLNTLEGYMYGLMMLVFVIMLHHQVQTLCRTYWERLEANYALRQKARSLEAEKRDVDASMDLNTRFLNSLGNEFKISLNDIISSLALLNEKALDANQQELLDLARKSSERQLDLVNNVVDFSLINTRQLRLNHNPFHLRLQLETWIQELAVEAHQQNVEIDFAIDGNVPARAEGDCERIGQVFKSLLEHAIAFSEQGNLFVTAELNFDNAKRDLLEVLIVDRLSDDQPVTVDAHSQRHKDAQAAEGVWFTICKGLADCLEGSLDIDRLSGRDTHYRFSVPLQIHQQAQVEIKANTGLYGRKVLLVDHQLELSQQHCEQLQDWGLDIQKSHSFAQVQQLLSVEGAKPVDLLMINVPQSHAATEEFMRGFLHSSVSQNMPVLLLLSHGHQDSLGLMDMLADNAQVHALYRPVVDQSLHDLLVHSLLGVPFPNTKTAVKDEMQGPSSTLSGTVLLVEDHKVNQMVAEAMLKKLGCEVLLADNGKEALDLYQQQQPDVILMDCVMPELDGYDAARLIREMEEGQADSASHTPIIAMTTYSSDEDQSRCMAAGMDAYLPKPFRIEALEEQVSRWLA